MPVPDNRKFLETPLGLVVVSLTWISLITGVVYWAAYESALVGIVTGNEPTPYTRAIPLLAISIIAGLSGLLGYILWDVRQALIVFLVSIVVAFVVTPFLLIWTTTEVTNVFSLDYLDPRILGQVPGAAAIVIGFVLLLFMVGVIFLSMGFFLRDLGEPFREVLIDWPSLTFGLVFGGCHFLFNGVFLEGFRRTLP